MIKSGLCPYKAEPVPYYRKVKAECETSYLEEVRTLLEYCLASQVHVIRQHQGKVRSDKAELEPCQYADGHCRTKDGGLVYWTVDASVKEKRTVWTGRAEGTGNILVVSALQEAYTLPSGLKVGTQITQEGVTVIVKSVTETTTRVKRDTDETVKNAVGAVQGEVTGKFQYLSSTTLSPMKSAIDNICMGMGVHDGMLNSLLNSAPDYFIRWILDNEYLTANIMDDVVLYWPCQPVARWFPTPNMTVCYSDLPINFHNGVIWMSGYLDTQNGDIKMQAPEVNCSSSVHWYKQEGKYYTMRGTAAHEVNADALHRLPMRVNKTALSDLLVPKWDNTWV
ncbi:unnamed protein product [Macrosiphum euphorbiae]|uniref:Uncharacterized protein n=1 Tax=Macrosiphum euphorbiae TaxID=13131 RepID=A0AAV0Y4J9_9HEMI|nr:unnamed protein product [Macrosiphum euphorbiae]